MVLAGLLALALAAAAVIVIRIAIRPLDLANVSALWDVSLAHGEFQLREHFGRGGILSDSAVRDLAVMLLHLLETVARFAGCDVTRSVAEPFWTRIRC
jgi:hypothetical protein